MFLHTHLPIGLKIQMFQIHWKVHQLIILENFFHQSDKIIWIMKNILKIQPSRILISFQRLPSTFYSITFKYLFIAYLSSFLQQQWQIQNLLNLDFSFLKKYFVFWNLNQKLIHFKYFFFSFFLSFFFFKKKKFKISTFSFQSSFIFHNLDLYFQKSL